MPECNGPIMMTKQEILDYYKDYVCFELTPDMVPDDGGLVVGNIDLPITTKCSLNCRNCCSLIPMYQEKNNFDIEEILKNLQSFLDCIDLVVRVNVLGGEPMLHPHLDRVIRFLNESDKVYHVVLTTNGTVVPTNPELYQALQHEKNEVRISAYNDYSSMAQKLIEKLTEEHIFYTIKRFGKEDFSWYDFGTVEDKDRSIQQIEEQFSRCDVEWKPLFGGKMYPCPRSAHATDLGLIPRFDEDYVDFSDTRIDIEDKKRKLYEFLHKKCFNACKYCDRGTDCCKEVIVAEQI